MPKVCGTDRPGSACGCGLYMSTLGLCDRRADSMLCLHKHAFPEPRLITDNFFHKSGQDLLELTRQNQRKPSKLEQSRREKTNYIPVQRTFCSNHHACLLRIDRTTYIRQNGVVSGDKGPGIQDTTCLRSEAEMPFIASAAKKGAAQVLWLFFIFSTWRVAMWLHHFLGYLNGRSIVLHGTDLEWSRKLSEYSACARLCIGREGFSPTHSCCISTWRHIVACSPISLCS